jgi:hypothetical protein
MNRLDEKVHSKSRLIFTIFSNILTLTLAGITFSYLGSSFDSDIDYENDWKRKYVIFFAWLILIYNVWLLFKYLNVVSKFLGGLGLGFPPAGLFRTILFIGLLVLVVNIVTSSLILTYLGFTFDKKELDPKDWKKKYIIFFSWVATTVCILSFLYIALYEKSFHYYIYWEDDIFLMTK